MKKSILFIALFALTATSFAQKDNVFNIKHKWMKTAGYTYQPGYHYGFSLFGQAFMSVGFAGEDKQYSISGTNDKLEPTWSMRWGWVGYTFDKDVTGWGAITFRPFVNMGMDFAKYHTLNSSKNKTYFTFAPSLEVNVYMVHFAVGYEIVPAFKELNGLNFGVGLSIPSSSSSNSSNNKKK